jgi:hypothetical protein
MHACPHRPTNTHIYGGEKVKNNRDSYRKSDTEREREREREREGERERERERVSAVISTQGHVTDVVKKGVEGIVNPTFRATTFRRCSR